MAISIEKTKVMAFQGKLQICSKICIYNQPIEQDNSFKYMGYNLSYIMDQDINLQNLPITIEQFIL